MNFLVKSAIDFLKALINFLATANPIIKGNRFTKASRDSKLFPSETCKV